MTYHPSILRIKVMNVWFNPILILLKLKKNCTTSFTSLCSPVHPEKYGIKSIRFGAFMGTHVEESFPNFIQLQIIVIMLLSALLTEGKICATQ